MMHDPPRIIRNEWFYFIARASMLAASAIGLPVAGYMLLRVINTGDAIAASVNSQAGKIDLLTQQMNMQFRFDASKLDDHESRLRAVELGKRQ